MYSYVETVLLSEKTMWRPIPTDNRINPPETLPLMDDVVYNMCRCNDFCLQLGCSKFDTIGAETIVAHNILEQEK